MNPRWLLTSVALIAIAGAARAQRPSFRAGVDAVRVEVSVTDGKQPVRSLTPDDFLLKDDDVVQTISDVAFATLPIDVRLLFDTSGSITDAHLASYARAMRQVTDALGPADRCEAFAFRRRIENIATLRPPPIDVPIHRTGADGTSFYDMVSLAMITTPELDRRQLTIVLSDGRDSSSFLDWATLRRAAERTDAVVYLMEALDQPLPEQVGLLSPNGPGAAPSQLDSLLASGHELSGERALQAVAALTGGSVAGVASTGNIGSSFLQVLGAFRQSYVLFYSPSGVDHTGWHALTLTVPNHSRYIVRARRGYQR